MPFNYKNPITPEQLKGAQSVSRSSTQGTNFSILGIGGYVEVYNLTDLIYTIPSGTTGPIQFSGNSLPITFTKGTGSSFSPDVLTLNSDNISSGRRRLGMLAYVKELDQVYQFDISNFETLWNAATGATGVGGSTVVFSDFGTTIQNNSAAGQNFINAWTGTSIEGYLGVTRSTSNWKKFWANNLGLTGGTYNGLNNTVTLINITGGSQSFIINTMSGLTVNGNLTVTGLTSSGTISATTYQNLPSDIRVTGASYSNNTFTFTNNTGGTYSVLFNTVTGLTVNGGLTITGNTSAQGLTATTISATTYQNLPTDIRVTGATYSNNTFTYTNNTGGTFNVLFNTVTGLTVNGNISTTGVTSFGNGTFTKGGSGTGDVLLDNNSTDTPGVLFYYANNSNYGIDSWNGSFDVLSGQLLRFTNKLNETGGAVKAAIDTTGNIVVTGFIKANAWRTGQVVNDIMLSNTEVTISTTTIATSNSDTDFLTYSYTPLSTSSYIVIHYHLASFSFEGGTGNDSYFSRIKVDGTEITYSRQSTVNGNRTGVLFPLTGRYTNSSVTAKSIVVACRRDSADDNITIVNTATSMWLRITEIAR